MLRFVEIEAVAGCILNEQPRPQHSPGYWALRAEECALKIDQLVGLLMTASGDSHEKAEKALVIIQALSNAVESMANTALAIQATGLKARDGMPEIDVPKFDVRRFGNQSDPWMN